MKNKNNKLERAQFWTGAFNLLQNHAKYIEGNDRLKRWRMDLREDNCILFTLYNEEDHGLVYSVFGRFKYPTKLGNRHSGKHNFHDTGKAEYALDRLKDYLTEIEKMYGL